MRKLSTILPLLAALALTLAAPLANAQVPRSHHVYIVAEENRSYEHIVGSSNMPYLNSLIAKGALATQFYANQHSSLPNYFWVTAGQPITNNNETTRTWDVDNIERRLLNNGSTFKSYAQSLPYTGFTGLYSGEYLKRHAPLPYYNEMAQSSLINHHVSTSKLSTDVTNDNLPDFAFITPDGAHDMHNCPDGLSACEQKADSFLKTYIAPLLKTPAFQPGGDGLLIIWADEADLSTDNRCSATISNGCGGRIAVVMIGPKVRSGYRSVTTYHHENVLRTMLEALGVSGSFPGAANTAYDMGEMFKTTSDGTNILAPAAGKTATSPVHVVANAVAPSPITAIKVYVDGVKVKEVAASAVDIRVPMSAGTHSLVIKSVDSNGNTSSKSQSVNAVAGVSFSYTTPSYWSGGNLPLNASSFSSLNPISSMHLYMDSKLLKTQSGSSISMKVSPSSGSHFVVYEAWDSKGNYYRKSQTVSVY